MWLWFADRGSAGKWVGALVWCALGGESGFFAVKLLTVFLVGSGEFDVLQQSTDAFELAEFLDFVVELLEELVVVVVGFGVSVLLFHGFSDSVLQGNRGSSIGEGHL